MINNRIVKISYTGRVKDGSVFDTTDERIAKDEGIYNDKKVYSPLPLVVGERHVIEGLDEALNDMRVGEEKTVEIPPEKAYGKRDPNLIRLVSLGLFKKKNINPVPGMVVELDGRYAKIQTVSGGRVRVDFNHELAGKTVVFDVKLEDEAKTKKDKIKFLIERSFNSSDGFNIKITGKRAEIEIPQNAYKDKNLLLRKASLSAELFKYIGLDEIIFREIWKNPEGQKEKK